MLKAGDKYKEFEVVASFDQIILLSNGMLLYDGTEDDPKEDEDDCYILSGKITEVPQDIDNGPDEIDPVMSGMMIGYIEAFYKEGKVAKEHFLKCFDFYGETPMTEL